MRTNFAPNHYLAEHSHPRPEELNACRDDKNGLCFKSNKVEPELDTLLNTSNLTLIGARWLLTMSAKPLTADSSQAEAASCIENGAVAFSDGVIVDVGDFESLREKYLARELGFSCEFFDEHILMPGLINNHGHLAMSLLRGYADDLPLDSWLQDHIWPAEAKWVSPEFVRDGSMLAMAEMLLAGTTTFTDMYFFPEECARAAEDIGMRGNLFFPILEFPSAWASGADEYFEKGLDLHDTFRHSELINIGFGPHAPYTVSDQSFEKVAMYSAELDAQIQVHLHETGKEIEDSIREYGCRPVERLGKLGILGARTQAVHVTQIEDDELELIADSGSSVIHCPSSNMKLASGFPPISKILQAGIPLGLGSDSAASNNSLDLFEEARLSTLVSKLNDMNAASFPRYSALYAATKGGAIAAGIEQTTGSIEVGKKADLIAIDTLKVGLQPLHNPFSQVLNTAAGNAVNHVWVNGEPVVSNKQLTRADSQDIIEAAQAWQSKLAR